MRESVPAEILPTHTAALFAEAVRRAAELLRAGEVVALPTETVYGLAANALNAAAVAKIFQIKGRPSHNPIIVHVADLALAQRCVAVWPALADKLAHAFWPGPLTLVLPRAAGIPPIVTANGPTVGVRWPSHPFIQAVIRECGFPLAAPSANRSNRLSPTNAEHVHQQLGDRIRLIVDGGQAQVGIESTVLDLAASPPRVLRPGMIHEASLTAVLGEGWREKAEACAGSCGSRGDEAGFRGELETSEVVSPSLESAAGKCGRPGDGPLRSPGQLRKHYAPKARLLVLRWRDEGDLRSQISDLQLAPSRTQVIAHRQIPSGEGFAGVSVIPHDAEAFARSIYAELHRCDAAGAAVIVVEALPDAPEWRGIGDRLRRAAAE